MFTLSLYIYNLILLTKADQREFTELKKKKFFYDNFLLVNQVGYVFEDLESRFLDVQKVAIARLYELIQRRAAVNIVYA